VPGPLALPSLEIHNFRGLRELKISRLGRANLIVGKNNVGKTSVLEAIHLYCRPGSVEILREQLDARDEVFAGSLRQRKDGRKRFLQIEGLFHGHGKVARDTEPIKIGPSENDADGLVIVPLFGQRTWGETSAASAPRPALTTDGSEREGELLLSFTRGGRRLTLPVADGEELARMESVQRFETMFEAFVRECVFVQSAGLKPSKMGEYWDLVALTPFEDEVETALRYLSQDIEGISFISGDIYTEERIPIVRLKGQSRPVPMRSLGDGAYRLLGIALALVNAKDGVLLIDEFENGLHYAIQPDVWRFIFQVAASLDVQVFATTHSSDCVEAFQAAASESEEDGVLIRLSRRGDLVRAVDLAEEELEIAVENRIEVR
jgi:energy-coupling factor transporter ATP-binding protein EcfA2